jgi:hypothetical protein
VRKLKHGAGHIEKLEILALNPSVFACRARSCLTVAPLQTVSQGNKVRRALGVCHVDNVNGTFGPPHGCEPMYVDDGNEAITKVITGEGRLACAMGLPDFQLILFASRAIEAPLVENAVLNVLSTSPFNLKATSGDRHILAARAHLASEVISPYREWVTIRVDFEGGKERFFHWTGLTISSTILVNRQNTSGRVDWTAASEQQERLYVEALRSKLREKTKTMCNKGAWLDEKRYNCDFPPSTGGQLKL